MKARYFMNIQNNQQNPEFGYWFFPPDSKHASVGNQLDVVIAENPTLEHFDPEKINLNVKAEQNMIEQIKIVHPWHFERVYQALPGTIEIIDRNGKKVEAFTFGGKLIINPEDTSTTCRLTSPAPILDISDANSLHRMFIDEFKILLAERSASLLSEHRVYEGHLVNADPFQLYLACLQELDAKFESIKNIEDDLIKDLAVLIHTERRRLREDGLLSGRVPTLEEVL
jgi:hypothetical protein